MTNVSRLVPIVFLVGCTSDDPPPEFTFELGVTNNSTASLEVVEGEAEIETAGDRVTVTASYVSYEEAVGSTLTIAAVNGDTTTSALQLEVRECDTLCTGGCELMQIVLQEQELDVSVDGIIEEPSCWRCVDTAANEVGSCF